MASEGSEEVTYLNGDLKDEKELGKGVGAEVREEGLDTTDL